MQQDLGTYHPPEEETPPEKKKPSDNRRSSDSDTPQIGTPVWSWGTGNTSAVLQISGLGSATATVEMTEEPAGCTTPGTMIYTATAVISGSTYTDTRQETIPATGHTFGEPLITTDDEGNTTIRYHCSGCGQDFEIGYSVEKEE